MADLLIDGAIAGDGTANSVVEYLIELERRRHELLLKNGCLDFEALRSRLRALEVDIAGLSTGFPTEQNDDVISIDNISKSPLKLDTVSEGGVNLSANSSAKPDSAAVDELETSIRSMDMKLEMETEHEANVRRSSLQSTGSAKERLGSIHSKQHRRLSIGSQPLYTMPNAFQYGIKLRDTKMNGMSMYEEPVEVGDVTAAASTASPADKRVQGSRERETNIRSITDKFSDSLNGSERASMDLRRALNAGEIVTNRTSFSMGAGSAQQPKQRAHSSDQRAHSSDQQAPSSLSSSTGPSLAKALLSGGGHNALMGDFDADMTLDSIDAPKRHSLMDLAEVMDEGDELLRGEGLSEEGDRLGSDASSAPEGAIEFCIVEADWAQLHQQSQQGHLLTPLLPPRRSWRYPMDLEDSAENNTKELQDQSFFFPSGVKVDLVWPSVAALRSRSNKHIRHIVPFTDAHGKPTYACVLTVTQTYDVSEIAQLGDLILPNLVNINRQKQSARCIQKCFRQYVAYRKMVTWQHKAVALPKPVAVDSPSLMRTSTIFGRMSSSSYPNVKEARTLDTSAHGGSSSTSGTGSAAGDGTTPTVQQQSRRTWSSFFSTSSSSRNNQPSSQPGSDVLDASSLHGAKRPGGGAVRSTSSKSSLLSPSLLFRPSFHSSPSCFLLLLLVHQRSCAQSRTGSPRRGPPRPRNPLPRRPTRTGARAPTRPPPPTSLSPRPS